MKVEMEDRKVTFPKELFEKNNLPEKGIYEARVEGREIHLSPPIEPPWGMIKSLQQPHPRASIDEIARSEVVEDG
jgi:hypothetical protein